MNKRQRKKKIFKGQLKMLQKIGFNYTEAKEFAKKLTILNRDLMEFNKSNGFNLRGTK